MNIIPLLFILFALFDAEENDMFDAIKRGNSEAYAAFFNRNYDALYRYLKNFGLEHEEVQDLVQNSFIYIWDHKQAIDSTRSLKAYLFKIGYSRMLNYMRDQKKINHPENLDFFEQIESDADTEISAAKNLDKSILKIKQRQTQQAISKAIESLAPKRQEAFRLCYLENFSYAEAAEIMGVSKKTVEHHMSLALADLREQLKKLI